MTHRDEELGLPGNREILEHALRTSTTQALQLAPETGSSHRSLAERGADLVRGFERVPAVPPAHSAPPPDSSTDASIDSSIDTDGGIPLDIAQAYLRARTEVRTTLAEH